MGMLSSDPRPRLFFDPADGAAKQSFKAECDINNIMLKYRQSGLLPHVTQNAGRFADVTDIGSYHEAIQRVRDTRDFFMKLPASMRAEFGHDAASFLDFISDPENLEEVRSLGLEEVVTPVEAGPEPAKVIPEPEAEVEGS